MKHLKEHHLQALHSFERKVLGVLSIASPIPRSTILSRLNGKGVNMTWAQIDKALWHLQRKKWVKQVSGGSEEGGYRPEYAKVVEIRGSREPTPEDLLKEALMEIVNETTDKDEEDLLRLDTVLSRIEQMREDLGRLEEAAYKLLA